MKSAKSFGLQKKLKKLVILRRVSGNSMLPTYLPGKILVASSLANVCLGSIVIFKDDGIEKIKRISKIDNDLVYILGDNPNDSTDSRHYGWIKSSRILASVIWPKL
jgi:phage repressor protein C with HTH and peptisase S24 domain